MSVVKKIKSRACSASDLSDKQWILLKQFTARADLLRLEYTINGEKTFEVFSFYQYSAIALKKSLFRIRLHVFVTSFKCKNDVTLSNQCHD